MTRRETLRDFLEGVAFPIAPAIAAGLLLSGSAELLAYGLWLVGVFASRSYWIPRNARFIYRNRLTRVLGWPLSTGDRDSYMRILRLLSWGWLLFGVLFIASVRFA